MKLSRHSRVTLIYVLAGAFWILLSDQLIDTFFSPALMTRMQTLKGWFFVIATATLLFFILKREIGQLEASQKSLQESNRRFSALVENLNGMVFQGRYDSRRTMTYVSNSAWHLTGYHTERFTGEQTLSYADIIHPDDRDAAWKKIRDDVAHNTAYRVTYRILSANQHEKWVWEQGHAIMENGKVTALEGIVTDITQLRNAETRLEAFRKIVDASPMVVCLWKKGQDWDVEMISENALELFGYRADDFISGKLKYRDVLHPDDIDRLNNEIISIVRNKSLHSHPFSQQYRIITKEGTVKWVEDRTLIRRNDQGRISHFQGIVFDITNLKNEEVKILALQSQLLQAQKLESVGRLAGGVAHDFNNLLSVVIGYTELILDELAHGHPHKESLSAILDAAQRAKILTRQLLAFGRKQMLEATILDVNTIISHFEKLLTRVLGEDISVVLMLEKQPCLIKADLSQMEQILMNLSINARDAMPGGGTLTIETGFTHIDEAYVAARPEATPGPHIMISISDTGTGMEKELINYIFEPFFTTKDSESGTGLGLSTVYGIVKQHGGNIWVYSEPGQGTTFKIYLPQVQTGVIKENIVKPVASALSEPQVFAATILIVEDDKAVRRLVHTVLENWGHKVLTSNNAEEAVDIARNHSGAIDLLLTDVVLPGIKGPQVFERIVRLQPNIKVLYMSGYTENVIFKQGMLEDGVHFIQKPFPIKALADKVAHILFT